jgi:hypothetical protein
MPKDYRPNHETMSARFEIGTLDRIAKASVKFESKADFVRDAVMQKLRAREAKKAGQPLPGNPFDDREEFDA